MEEAQSAMLTEALENKQYHRCLSSHNATAAAAKLLSLAGFQRDVPGQPVWSCKLCFSSSHQNYSACHINHADPCPASLHQGYSACHITHANPRPTSLHQGYFAFHTAFATFTPPFRTKDILHAIQPMQTVPPPLQTRGDSACQMTNANLIPPDPSPLASTPWLNSTSCGRPHNKVHPRCYLRLCAPN